jgi:hypothetical protein
LSFVGTGHPIHETGVHLSANDEKGKVIFHGIGFVDKDGKAEISMNYLRSDDGSFVKPPSGTYSLIITITSLYWADIDIEAAKKWVGDKGTVIPGYEDYYDVILKDNIEVEYKNPDDL